MKKDCDDEYVQPPSYVENASYNDELISKLKLKIQQDLNQINGVYNSQISDAEEKKRNMIEKVELEYTNTVDAINKQRMSDISSYNSQAERNIENLMLNSPQQIIAGWWERLFG
mgnify:FL=1